MSGDHTSPNPFLDSTYGHGYPVQFPLQGDVRAFWQTGHATERNNYGAVEVSKAVLFSYFPSAFVQSLKALTWLMKLLAGSVTINHVVGIKKSFSFFVS